MKDLPLHLDHDVTGVSLIPVSVERLGDAAKLDDQVSREVLGLYLAPLLPPEPEQGGFVVAHDDPCIRCPDEAAPVP
jgi:hypothetical protein